MRITVKMLNDREKPSVNFSTIRSRVKGENPI